MPFRASLGAVESFHAVALQPKVLVRGSFCMLLSYEQVSQLGISFVMTTTTVLSVRVSKEERAILEAASEQARTSLSEFVRRKAVEAAESDMLERRIVTIPAKDWEAFEAWAQRPAEDIAALKELASKDPTWRR